jgi:enamine deaminase RidA (YjgF/YER057c/UK114 family)
MAVVLRPSVPAGWDNLPSSSHVVEVSGAHRTAYLAGQTGVDASGKVAEGFRAQALQVFENVKAALTAIGGGFEHIVKLNNYLTDIEANVPEFREVHSSYFPNKSTLPASTLLQVQRLSNPAFLLEVEAVAVLPRRRRSLCGNGQWNGFGCSFHAEFGHVTLDVRAYHGAWAVCPIIGHSHLRAR